MASGRILSGMRPTAKLHLGNLLTLENWIRLQPDYECFFVIVDWHALTTGYEDTSDLQYNIREMAMDWISAGIDPDKSVVFRQSDVKEHAELHLLFSMITPLGWLERCPTYKEQLQQLSTRDITTYGFLGYPVLQAADILIYKADTVPVGEDQLPHVEITREIARRFNFLYGEVFPEPQAKMNRVSLLPGTDGRKMSKSYGNAINISDPPDVVRAAVRNMVTDPARVRKSDPGHPDVCTVFAFYKAFAAERVDTVRRECEGAEIGCVACKNSLADVLLTRLAPVHEVRARLAADPSALESILKEGAARAREVAHRTMTQVRAAMNL